MCDLCGPGPGAAVIDHAIGHPFELKPDTDMMCVMCDQHLSVHPDKYDFLAKREMENIIEHGHEVRVVFGDPLFAYSIGRSVKDRPELLITGSLPPKTLGYIVNRVAEIDGTAPVSAGMDLDGVLDGYKVRLVQVRDLEAAEMFGVTSNFGTDDTSALQILWPDRAGNFPGDPDFGYPPEAQPVFA